ncbi:hypothetical protein M378DRAFT_531134 [Amanita muscaria Koide BX008]|uniref:Uncharacterized protein n=1 Tax=Amanita muscaria (strain Koide BX008) TaxID=946122 RepID=A0A0C2W577_AMAMK|nr:hypothetical protein M378DRAFT_531134 [Amanita muscaria Koide BX008]
MPSHRRSLTRTVETRRSDPIRNDGNRLFPTLAWQLALSVPGVKRSHCLFLVRISRPS